MTIRTALLQGTKLLEDAAIAVPRLTAEVLLSKTLGCERPFLFAHSEQELREVEWLHYGRYLHERLQGKPTQYITRRQEFYGREFRVTPAVLIPRPETEHVVEAARKHAGNGRRVVDVGTGSGAIAITLQLETGAETWATDISVPALSIATENNFRLRARVRLVACDLVAALGARSFDIVVANPPYVPLADAPGLQREVRDYEPRIALFGGPTGLEIYERLVREAPRVLRPGGRLIMELGFGALERVQAMFGPEWEAPGVEPDLAGIPRVITARLRNP